MRKQVLTLSAIALLTVTAIFTGCKKDDKDTTNPVVTVNGGNTTYWQLNKTYTDPGATGSDETDGTLVVSNSGTVNTAVIGTYIITYTAKDAEGNKGTATRTVYVVNFDGSYALVQSACTDTAANGNAPSIISASGVTAANGMTIGYFGLYPSNNVSATFSGTSITVARQGSATGIAGDKIEGTGTITGSGTVSSPLRLTFQIKEVDAAGVTFNQGTATFTHN